MRRNMTLSEARLRNIIQETVAETVKSRMNGMNGRRKPMTNEKKLYGKISRIVRENLQRKMNEDLDDYRGGQWMRSKYPEGKQGDIDYSWDMLNDVDPDLKKFPSSRMGAYPEYDHWGTGDFANRERLHTLNRQTDAVGDWQRGDHAYFADGEPFPSTEYVDRYRNGNRWVDDADREMDKNDMKSVRNKIKDHGDYTKADKRPLHRKGSLNRA